MGKPRIMVVDDEKLVLNAIERALRKEKYELILMNNPQEAFESLKKDPNVDMIICDHRMPKMTGMELLIEVRRLFPQIVRILLTGHADLEVAIHGINEGKLYRFLTKPWQDIELKNHIRQGLAFKRLVREARAAVEKSRHALISKKSHNDAAAQSSHEEM